MVTQATRFHREACYAVDNEGNGTFVEDFSLHPAMAMIIHCGLADCRDPQSWLAGNPWLVTSVSFWRPKPCNTIRAGSNRERCLPRGPRADCKVRAINSCVSSREGG